MSEKRYFFCKTKRGDIDDDDGGVRDWGKGKFTGIFFSLTRPTFIFFCSSSSGSKFGIDLIIVNTHNRQLTLFSGKFSGNMT